MPEPNLDRWAREVVEQSKGRLRTGLGLTLVLHILVQAPVFFFLLAIASSDWMLTLAGYSLMYLGLSQLVYMIPAILIFRRRGDTETAKGLIVGASLTFLLNANCNGLLFWSN